MKESFEVKKGRDPRFKIAFSTNVLKTFIAYVTVSVIGYICYRLLSIIGFVFYRFMLKSISFNAPSQNIFLRTVVFSLMMFAVLIYVAVKLFMLPVRNKRSIDEMSEIEESQRASGYDLDYKEYFKKQLKTRLWGSFVLVFVLQLPLIINYAMVSSVTGFNIYNSTVSIYKFYTPSLFVWEILGDFWIIAPILFSLLYAVTFSYFLYSEQKKRIPPKPDGYKE